MKKILLLLASSIILIACASGPLSTSDTSASYDCLCSDDSLDSGFDNIAVVSYTYKKESNITLGMKLKFKAEKGGEFKIQLKPGDRNSRSAKVVITGVSGTTKNNTSTPFAWLDGESTFNENPYIILEVPDIEAWYKFDIWIEDIGMIDPRVDVN
jgi:hypothetical protein